MKFFLDNYKDFNFLKFIVASIGAILIIRSLFLKDLTSYFWTISIGWFLICYAITLRRYNKDLLDLEPSRIWRMGISYIFLILGSMFLKNYRLHRKIKISRNKEYTLMLFLGVLFYVLSKAILIVIELDLTHYTQYLTVLALTSLTIGKIVNSITSGKLLFRLSLIYYSIGFLVFLFNLSYNPDEKTQSIKIVSFHE